MKYFSTRGGDQLLSFEEVRIEVIDEDEHRPSHQTVLTGLAPNGGLYIPVHIPSLPPSWQEDWKAYSFVDLSVAVLSLYISEDEISRPDLRTLVEKSYQTFRHPDTTPVVKVDEKTFVLELFHGPTFAFKDVALQLLGNLFEFFLKRRNASKPAGAAPEKLTVVGATSGDTGRRVYFSYHEGLVLTLHVARQSTASETRRTSPSSFCTQRGAYLRSKRPK
jgi:threonine synthase